ncbi:MAG: lysostaphin resistance A-like protein [Candidatus Acidiferrales bacterium]
MRLFSVHSISVFRQLPSYHHAPVIVVSGLSLVFCQVGLLLIAVPVLSELVFRGIAFRFLRAASSFWPAAIGSSLLFACVWSVPTTSVAVILGVASALVFRKTRALVSSIIANATLTILVETFLYFTICTSSESG